MANYLTNNSNNMAHLNQQQNRYSIENLMGHPTHACCNQNCHCSTTHYDAQADLHYVTKTSERQRRPPPPISTNLLPIDSPARSKRGSPTNDSDDDDFQTVTHYKKKKESDRINGQNIQRQQCVSPNNLINGTVDAVQTVATSTRSNFNNNQPNRLAQQKITEASARYAETRFPFPPYIARFKSDLVTLNKFKEEIINHFNNTLNLKMDILILNCRASKVKCSFDKTDILLYLKNPSSFVSLHDQTQWPTKIVGEVYSFPSWPSIPPQLSLIMKNVNLRIDFEEMADEIKTLVQAVKNVIRTKNKFGNNTHMIKLEFSSAEARQELLEAKK